MLNPNFINLKWHVLAWASFITYEVGIVALLDSGFPLNASWDQGLHYVVHILLFYFHALVVLPLALSNGKRHYFVLVLLIIFELTTAQLLKYDIYWFLYAFHFPLTPPFGSHLNFTLAGIWRTISFIGYSTAYWFATTSIKKRKKIADLEKIKLNIELSNQKLESKVLAAENAYLKAQINPHFLFNTLNFLYNSVAKMDDRVADSVMALSDIMRYGLSETDEDGKVPLELEIEHIRNFIRLNQVRFNERLNVALIVNGSYSQIRIMPLILMTLTENIFKYGDLFNVKAPALIVLTVTDSRVLFHTKNLKRTGPTEKGLGIGLQNIKERLTLHHKYNIDVSDHDEVFEVLLELEV